MVVLLALWWPRVVLAAMWCNYKTGGAVLSRLRP